MGKSDILEEAKRLQKENKFQESLSLLKNSLKEDDIVNRLLWLAKATDNEREAFSAAEVALMLEAENEVAKRAIISLNEKFSKKNVNIDISQLTGMTLSEARSTMWTFKGINKPIGVLIDSAEISLRDISWALENAYDGRVQQACKTILLNKIFPDKSGEPLKPAKFISGKNYTAYQRRRALIASSALSGFLLGFAFLFIFTLSGSYILNRFEIYKDIIGNIYGWGLIFIIVAILWFENKFSNDSENYSLGEEAENKSVDALRSLLQEPWVIIRNFEFPDRSWGDIDLIVLGRGGIWAIEVKGYTSQVRNIGDKWQYRNKFGWFNLSKNPGKQARKNAQRLKNFLDLKGVNVRWVEGIVLWAGREENLQIKNPQTSVWKLSDLADIEKLEFWKRQKIDDKQLSEAVNILDDVLKAKK